MTYTSITAVLTMTTRWQTHFPHFHNLYKLQFTAFSFQGEPKIDLHRGQFRHHHYRCSPDVQPRGQPDHLAVSTHADTLLQQTDQNSCDRENRYLTKSSRPLGVNLNYCFLGVMYRTVLSLMLIVIGLLLHWSREYYTGCAFILFSNELGWIWLYSSTKCSLFQFWFDPHSHPYYVRLLSENLSLLW